MTINQRKKFQCLLPGWFISVDIQLAVIGGILLLIVTKFVKIGFLVTILVYISSVTTTLVIVRRNQFHGLLSYARYKFSIRITSLFSLHARFQKWYFADFGKIRGIQTSIITFM